MPIRKAGPIQILETVKHQMRPGRATLLCMEAEDSPESLPPAAWHRAQEAAARADVILVVGTSAVVYPAVALATHYNGRAFVAEINPERTAISDRVDCVLTGTAAGVLPYLAAD